MCEGQGSRRETHPLAALAALLALAAAAAAGDRPEASASTSDSLDFDACVHLALRQSPVLTSSRMDVDLRRLDESDARQRFLPSVTLRTRYFVNPPAEARQPYSLRFTTDFYNPVQTVFEVRAGRLMTEVAVLAHRRAVREGLRTLGGMFLDAAAAEAAESVQREVEAAARQAADVVRLRLASGDVAAADLAVAEQEAEIAGLERAQIEAARAALLERMAAFLGLEPGCALRLDARDSRGQVLGGFSPASVSTDQIRDSSEDLRIMELDRKLRKLRVVAAYAAYVPQLGLSAETPDVLNGRADGGIYFALGLDVPVWDRLARQRDVRRQKILMAQGDRSGEAFEADLLRGWRSALSAAEVLSAQQRLARAQEDLASLREKRAALARAGQPADAALAIAARRTRLESQKIRERRELEYDKAALDLRSLSGDLCRAYVAFEEP